MKRNNAAYGRGRIGLFLALACLTVLGTALVVGAAPAAAETNLVNEIKDRGELVVAVDGRERYPYYYHDADGKVMGSDVDLVRDIAVKLGVKLRLDEQARTPEEAMEKVFLREADMAASGLKVFLTDAKRIAYSVPYFSTYYSLMVNRREFAKLKREGDMLDIIRKQKCRIGTVRQAFYKDYVQRMFPQAEVVLFNEDQELIDAVLAGQLMAAFCDEVQSKACLLREPIYSIKLRWLLLTEQRDYIGLAVAYNSRHFLGWLNLYLNNSDDLHKDVDAMLGAYPLSK